MISSDDGLAMLRNWKRAKTILSFFKLLDDVRIDREVRIVELRGFVLTVENVRGKPTPVTFDLAGALFDRLSSDDLPGELLSMSPEEKARFSAFLLIRLAGNGLRLCFANPAFIN